MVRSFAADVTRWTKKTKLSGEVVLRKVAFDGYRGLLFRSPVDTGRFRGNWRISIGFTDRTTTEATSSAGPGAPPTTGEASQAILALGRVRWRDSIHISNSLPYAEVLEAGSSNQAPNGILSQTFHELRANVHRNVVAVSRRR